MFEISGLKEIDWSQTKVSDPCSSRIISMNTSDRKKETELVDSSSSSNEGAQQESHRNDRVAQPSTSTRLVDQNDQDHKETTLTEPQNPIPDITFFQAHMGKSTAKVPNVSNQNIKQCKYCKV